LPTVFENLSSRKMFWLESHRTTKMIMFAINKRRFTCGVVEDLFKSLSGSKPAPSLPSHRVQTAYLCFRLTVAESNYLTRRERKIRLFKSFETSLNV
jgi:hypothetical protein